MVDLIERLRRAFGRGGPTVTLPATHLSLTGWQAAHAAEALAGSVVISDEGTGATAALGRALGLCLTGHRAAALLSGRDVARATEVLGVAVGRMAPLLIHVAARADARHALVDAVGHDALERLAGAGAVVLVATSAQEVVDLALVGRRFAETALRPVVVAQDFGRTHACLQDLRVPEPASIDKLLGRPTDEMAAATHGQRLLFGEYRTRVPKWLDPDRPAALGGKHPAGVWGLGVAAQLAMVDGPSPKLLTECAEAWAGLGGQLPPLVERSGNARAHIVFVAMGSAAEIARGVAESTNGRAAVICVRALTPVPVEPLAAALRGATRALVLERHAAQGEGSLVAAVRQAADWGGLTPTVERVRVGIGGLPIRAEALAGLLEGASPPEVLGAHLPSAETRYPKRRAMADAMSRAVTLAAAPSDASPLDLRPEGAITIGVQRARGGSSDTANRIAAVLQGATHLGLRVIPGIGRGGAPTADRIVLGATPLRDPGDGGPVDVVVLQATDGATQSLEPERVAGGLVLCLTTPEPEAPRFEDVAMGSVLAAIRDKHLSETKDRALQAAYLDLLGGRDDTETEARVAAFKDGLGAPATPLSNAIPPARHRPAGIPGAVRALPPLSGSFGSLPDFWGEVGVLYRDRRTEELGLEPATLPGAVPPASSAARSTADIGTSFPMLDAALCTGCGDCWAACPDNAIGGAAHPVRKLLEAGIALAADAGLSGDALRSMIRPLALSATDAFARAETAPKTAGELLDPVVAAQLAAAGLPAERRDAIEQAWAAVRPVLADLPTIRAEPFFGVSQAASPGKGELLTLVINPDACKGCGICTAVCQPGALTEGPRSSSVIAPARDQYRVWEALPDTTGPTIERVRANAEVGAAAGNLLSRHCASSLLGGDEAPVGSAAKAVLRVCLGTVEAVRQPAQSRQVEALDALQGRVSERIRSLVADGLPTEDLGVLSQGLDALARGEARLSALSGRLEDAYASGRLDTSALRGLVEVGKRLADRRWLLGKGPTTMGRARALVISSAGAVDWLGAFPTNSMALPMAVVEPAALSGVADGVARGLAQDAIAAATDRRQANAALGGGKDQSATPDSWSELDPAERSACAPLIVIVDGDQARSGVVAQLLSSVLPVKIVVLERALNEHLRAPLSPRPGWFTVRSTVAHRDHLAGAIWEAVRYPGPAFIQIYAPQDGPDGLVTAAADVEQGRVTLGMVDPDHTVPTPETPTVDPEAINALERKHASEVAALQAAHASELATLRDTVQREVAGKVRDGLLQLAAQAPHTAEAS